MKVAVMGAGAVGCYFGGMLARAGHEVVLVGRPSHVDAIREHGLRLETLHFDERIALQASTTAQALEGSDVVLFCVKSTDTAAAAAEILPFLAADTLVLSLQNGVENAERLRESLPQPVAAAVVYVAAEMAGAGHVKHLGRGELVIEPAVGSEQVAQTFAAAGIPTELSNDVRAALWFKLIINCAYNALSAITQMPYGKLVERDGVTRVIDDVLSECLTVADAEKITLPGDIHAAVRGIARSMAGQRSSTAQDLARGKLTEIDYLNGFIVRRGELLGIATPANRTLHTLVKLLETRPHDREA